MKILSTIVLSIIVGKATAFAPSNRLSSVSTKTSNTLHAEKYQEGQERRDFLNLIPAALITAATAATGSFPAFAIDQEANSPFIMYRDETAGFEVKTPSGWQKSEQSLPDRRRIVLFVNPNENDASADKDLMFIAYTPVRDDFTALSSFGSVDQVGQMTILPKGEIAGQESESKMLDSESKKNSYYFDYVTKTPDQPKRHLRTVFNLVQGATGGGGAVLVTITVQTTDDRYEALKGTFGEIIDSYGKIKK